MDAKSGLMLNALLNHFHKGSFDHLFKFLSQERVQALSDLPVPSSLPTQSSWSPKEIIQKIHYSWLAKPIEHFSDHLQPLVLSSLPEAFRNQLMLLVHVKAKMVPIDSPLNLFFLRMLCQKVYPADLLPVEFLPESPLNDLLQLSKNQLVHLMDLVGLYDLAIDLRKVLDKVVINNAFSFLPNNEQELLKYCLKQQDVVIAPPEGIQKWVAGAKHFSSLLHLKGLYRLSAALSSQSKDLVWHLTRQLDIGRGTKIEQLASSNIAAHLTPKQSMLTVNQVMTIVELFLRQEGKKS